MPYIVFYYWKSRRDLYWVGCAGPELLFSVKFGNVMFSKYFDIFQLKNLWWVQNKAKSTTFFIIFLNFSYKKSEITLLSVKMIRWQISAHEWKCRKQIGAKITLKSGILFHDLKSNVFKSTLFTIIMTRKILIKIRSNFNVRIIETY